MDTRERDVFRIKIEQKLQSLHKSKYPVKVVGAQQKTKSDLKDMAHGQTRRVTQSQLLDIVNVVMVFQQHAIELGDHVNYHTRLQLLFILFQAALTIVINAYNLATFLINSALQTNQPRLDIGMSFFFYGFHILCSALHVFLTVFAFTTVYNSIQNTTMLVIQLNLYTSDVALRSRLMEFAMFVNTTLHKYSIFGLYNLDGSLIAAIVSGTLTYIILLIQYGNDNDGILGKSQYVNRSTNDTV